jgi:hypothetical protein
MSREAIEEAIEVLEDASAEMLQETGDKNYYIEAIAVLRQALVDADDTSQERVDEIVKDEHEPVAWRFRTGTFWNREMRWRYLDSLEGTKGLLGLQPLYAAPQKKEWVGLTDEDISAVDWKSNETLHDYARHIELKLRGKNT